MAWFKNACFRVTLGLSGRTVSERSRGGAVLSRSVSEDAASDRLADASGESGSWSTPWSTAGDSRERVERLTPRRGSGNARWAPVCAKSARNGWDQSASRGLPPRLSTSTEPASERELTVSKPCPAPGEQPREKMAQNGTGKPLFRMALVPAGGARSYPKHGLLVVYDVSRRPRHPASSAISGDSVPLILCAALAETMPRMGARRPSRVARAGVAGPRPLRQGIRMACGVRELAPALRSGGAWPSRPRPGARPR
jgi:hypothetical protein